MKWSCLVTSTVQMKSGFTTAASEILKMMRKMTGTVPMVVLNHSGPCSVPDIVMFAQIHARTLAIVQSYKSIL